MTAVLVLVLVFSLCSCDVIHRTFSKKAEITFDANGGIVTGSGVDTDGPSDPEVYTAKCIVGDSLSDFTASKDYYDFIGWYTERDGGKKVTKGPEKDRTLYAHWESANKDRSVEITDISVSRCDLVSKNSDKESDDKESGSGKSSDGKESGSGKSSDGKESGSGKSSDDKESDGKESGSGKDSGDSGSNFSGKVRISSDESENDLEVTFTLSKWFGQDVAFVNKKGEVKKDITVDEDAEDFSDSPVTVTCKLPSRKWMDNKEYSYYIQSLGNEHVDASDRTEIHIILDGQIEDFDKPIEGSMVWYGGSGDAPEDRAGVIVATDDDYVYAWHEDNDSDDADTDGEAGGSENNDNGAVETRGGKLYKWEKKDVMINLADVRTDIIYNIYNAYSSRFFPIRGKAMYTDNGGKGLKRYDAKSFDEAVHENAKTGKTTFMVPVQWDFAQTVASAQSKARDAGVTLYIVDSFRPMDSVGPVAKKVDNAALLAYGGTSAHNFGLAVDTGWQRVDEKGEPIGDPYDKNLQELDKKKAKKGPRGNEHEIWWEGVNKLEQEWWHYGYSILSSDFREQAKRVGDLYVNEHDCISRKRSKLWN